MKQWTYIRAVGCELEAGFSKKMSNLHEDESLVSSHFTKSACRGELISDPLKSEEEAKSWLEESYKHVCETPVVAAYHIHISFKHINYYAKCMESAFHDAFFKHMEQWGKDYPIRNPHFWDRLHGKNKYCQPEFRAEAQAKCKNKDEARKGDLRRTALNYAYGQHKTIENRLFPTFVTFDAAWSGTKAYLDFIENYLEKNPVSEDEILMEVVDNEELLKPEDKTPINEVRLRPFNLYKRNDNFKQMKPYNYNKQVTDVDKTFEEILEGAPLPKRKYNEKIKDEIVAKIQKTRLEIPKDFIQQIKNINGDEKMGYFTDPGE